MTLEISKPDVVDSVLNKKFQKNGDGCFPVSIFENISIVNPPSRRKHSGDCET